jgi:hypothetical protein
MLQPDILWRMRRSAAFATVFTIALAAASAPAQTLPIVRAVGPGLAAAGVLGPLPDPILTLHDSEGTLLATNDDWRSDQEREIIATGLAPQDERDSAIVVTLVPTAYTAIVRGKDGATGIALVEIFEVDGVDVQ